MLKDTEKRQQIEQQLKHHPELDYTIFEAVEGRRLTPEQQAEMILPEFKTRYKVSATLPAAGCSLSHIGIYKEIIESNIEYALILEDDASLAKHLQIEYLTEILKDASPIAILLTPDLWYNKNRLIKELDYDHKVYEVETGYMTSGYLINRTAAEILLQQIYPVQYKADEWEIFITFGIHLYGVVPHLTSFPAEPGEIGKAGVLALTPYQKFRYRLIVAYLWLKNIPAFIKGRRKSSIKWR